MKKIRTLLSLCCEIRLLTFYGLIGARQYAKESSLFLYHPTRTGTFDLMGQLLLKSVTFTWWPLHREIHRMEKMCQCH